MIDILESEGDKQTFISTPLAAALFGRKQLSVSALKTKVENDSRLLQKLGAGDVGSIKRGILPYIENLSQFLASNIIADICLLDEYRPMLEYIARDHNPTWRLLARIHKDVYTADTSDLQQQYLRRFIMDCTNPEEKATAWSDLADLYMKSGNIYWQIHALLEVAMLNITPFDKISDIVDYFNSLWKTYRWDDDDRRSIAVRLSEVMERRLSEAGATDCSRLAWLCLHLGDELRAARIVGVGLEMDSENRHLLQLAEKLR